VGRPKKKGKTKGNQNREGCRVTFAKIKVAEKRERWVSSSSLYPSKKRGGVGKKKKKIWPLVEFGDRGRLKFMLL